MTDWAVANSRGFIHGNDWIFGATLRAIGKEKPMYVVLRNIPAFLDGTWAASIDTTVNIANKWCAARSGFWEGPPGFISNCMNTLAWTVDRLQPEYGAEYNFSFGPDMNWPNPMVGLVIPEQFKAQNGDKLEGSKNLGAKKKQIQEPVDVFVPVTINPRKQRMTNLPCVCEHHLNAHGQREPGGSWWCFVATCSCRAFRYTCPECSHVSMRGPSHAPECRTGLKMELEAEPEFPGKVLRHRLSTSWEIEVDPEV